MLKTICIFGASSNNIESIFFTDAEKTGESLADDGYKIVFGGGADGLMGACARGAKSRNGYVIGIIPEYFNKPEIIFTSCDEVIVTDTMSERKSMMLAMADAFIVLPGGIGTFDEFFEIITLRSVGRHKKPIILLNTDNYYQPVISLLNSTASKGFMSYDDISFAEVAESPSDICGILNKYKNKYN